LATSQGWSLGTSSANEGSMEQLERRLLDQADAL